LKIEEEYRDILTKFSEFAAKIREFWPKSRVERKKLLLRWDFRQFLRPVANKYKLRGKTSPISLWWGRNRIDKRL